MRTYLEMKNDEFSSHYYGSRERTTLDGEWTESELKDNVWDDCNKAIKEWKERKKNKEVKLCDDDLILPDYLAEIICNEEDIIERYNKLADKHRLDVERLFNIAYFDNWCLDIASKKLKNNIVK